MCEYRTGGYGIHEIIFHKLSLKYRVEENEEEANVDVTELWMVSWFGIMVAYFARILNIDLNESSMQFN